MASLQSKFLLSSYYNPKFLTSNAGHISTNISYTRYGGMIGEVQILRRQARTEQIPAEAMIMPKALMLGVGCRVHQLTTLVTSPWVIKLLKRTR
jgi:hypothetical protein